jgi:hypothetical protein
VLSLAQKGKNMINKKSVLLSVALIAAAIFVSTVAGQFQPGYKLPPPKFPALAPNITDASYICLGGSGTEFAVQGQFFGSTQGARRVLVNGVPIPHVSMWGPGTISGTGPLWDVDHSYKISIDDGTRVISNVLPKQFPFQWDTATPSHAAPKAEILLVGWGGGPTQAGKIIKMGTAVMTVISWAQTPSSTENTIRARVPKLLAGTYQITMYKGGANITKSALNFIVN